MKRRFSIIKISRRDAESCKELFTCKYESDLETSRKFELGQEFVASATDSDLRNIGFHRKLFALLKLAMDSLPEHLEEKIKSVDELLTEIKIQIGHREKRVSIGGNEYYVPKSISFENLGQEAFEDFYSKTLDFICAHVLPGVTDKEIETQLLNFM